MCYYECNNNNKLIVVKTVKKITDIQNLNLSFLTFVCQHNKDVVAKRTVSFPSANRPSQCELVI